MKKSNWFQNSTFSQVVIFTIACIFCVALSLLSMTNFFTISIKGKTKCKGNAPDLF